MKLFEKRPQYGTREKRRYMAIRHALASHRVEYGDVGTGLYVAEMEELERKGVGQAIRSSLQAVHGK